MSQDVFYMGTVEYLRFLAGRLMDVPGMYGIDGADIDRLRAIAAIVDMQYPAQTSETETMTDGEKMVWAQVFESYLGGVAISGAPGTVSVMQEGARVASSAVRFTRHVASISHDNPMFQEMFSVEEG